METNKEFIPYEQALELKELGFDENYIACYSSDGKLHPKEVWKHKDLVKAPLYQQAFRWFREKHNLFSCIMTEYSYGGHISTYYINGVRQSNISVASFTTYEEAELACLKELIEIVKN